MEKINCSCGTPIDEEEFYTMGHSTEDGEESVEWSYECENCKREYSGYEWTDYISNDEIFEYIKSELEEDKKKEEVSNTTGMVLLDTPAINSFNGSISSDLHYTNLARGSRPIEELFPTQVHRRYDSLDKPTEQ